MKNSIILLYGGLAYLMFLAVFIYAIGFVGNIGLANSIDAIPKKPLMQALIINLSLLAIFAVQHSVMARTTFKKWLTQYIPESAERSTYVLFSNLAMIAIFIWWEPMGGIVWQFESTTAKTILFSLYMFGWATVLISTFLINHFELFGLQQIWRQWQEIPMPTPKFVMPSLYKLVRHPLYVGWIVVFWASATMTVAHLLFAVMCTAYIVIAIRFEEKDLVNEFGEQYQAYQKNVPMLVPTLSNNKIHTTNHGENHDTYQ